MIKEPCMSFLKNMLIRVWASSVLVRVLQNKNSNYETDVFLPLINELINLWAKNIQAIITHLQ